MVPLKETNEQLINCIAVDDEPLALQQMEDFIEKVTYLHLTGTFDNPINALSFLKTKKVDLVFLDVEMDTLSGLQFIEVLDQKPLIILTTAYESYAIKGYDLNVFDYLLKPVVYSRFLKSVSRAYDLLTNAEKTDPGEAERDYMFVKTEHLLQKVAFDEIRYIEGLSNYLILNLKNEKVYVLMSFGEIETLLPPNRFFRIHKSFIIALDKVDRITKTHVEMNNKSIPVGQTYKARFFDELRRRRLI